MDDVPISEFPVNTIDSDELDHDPGPTRDVTIDTEHGEMEITTDVGWSFGAMMTAIREIEFVESLYAGDSFFDDLDEHGPEYVEDRMKDVVDPDDIEHVQDVVKSNLTNSTPGDVVELASIETLFSMYEEVVNHAVARSIHDGEDR